VHLVEIFLPLVFPYGAAVPEPLFEVIKAELTETFGGVTVYARAPASGLWKKEHEIEKDVLVILEVMAKDLDKEWWKGFRQRTEALFHQEELLVRTTQIARL
jgi:hypothetical protein